MKLQVKTNVYYSLSNIDDSTLFTLFDEDINKYLNKGDIWVS